MVEEDAVQLVVAALRQAQDSSLQEIRQVHDVDLQPLSDGNYPCITVDWDESGEASRPGNQVSQELYLVASLYVANAQRDKAWRDLRRLLKPFQKVLLTVRGGRTADGHVYHLQPKGVKSGQRLGGTYTAAAFCRIAVQQRGPL